MEPQRLRLRFYRLLRRYLTARVDNYFVDDHIAEMEQCQSDPVVCSIARGLYSLYDDTHRHLWLHAYSEDVANMYAVWLYILKSDVPISKASLIGVEGGKGTSFWSFASFEQMREVMGGYMEQHPFEPFYSPINNHLLINYRRNWLLPRNLVRKSMRNALTHAIMCRSPENCRTLWGLSGLNREVVIAYATGNGVAEPIACRLIPEDGICPASESFTQKDLIISIIKNRLSTTEISAQHR